MRSPFFILVLMFLSYGCATESEEVVGRPSRSPVRQIFLENEQITAYFEVTNLGEYKKMIPSIFSMPERPLSRVSVIDYYKMEAGPPYLESMIDILVKYKKPQSEKENVGWYHLEEPVTTENALWGRFIYGFPKVVRKITFERHEDRHVGTSYARDSKTVGFKLMLEAKKTELTPDEKSFLEFISPLPTLTIKDGGVFTWAPLGRGKYRIYELEKSIPQSYNVKFGDGSIEYGNDPMNYLHRVGVGKFITGYWVKQRFRFETKPME